MSQQFTVFPAIDLRRGRCVRLRRGDVAAETAYSDQPAGVAQRWQNLGAEWLHVVNLDGAIESPGVWRGPNISALRAILSTVNIPVQFGGGIRSLASIESLLSLGVARVILGTIAVTQPDLVREAVHCFGPGRVLVSLDTRRGYVATHGWTKNTAIESTRLGAELKAAGIETVVHTDIERDGMLAGANAEASVALAKQTGLCVIVSGGVAHIDDIIWAARHAAEGLAGIIVGQALYTGAVTLSEALAAARLATMRQTSRSNSCHSVEGD